MRANHAVPRVARRGSARLMAQVRREARMFLEIDQVRDELARARGLERDRIVTGRCVVFTCRAEEGHAAARHRFETYQSERLDAAVGEHAVARAVETLELRPRERAFDEDDVAWLRRHHRAPQRG